MNLSIVFPPSMVVAVFGTFLVSLFGTYLVRELARRRAILDAPNERSSHVVPVPRLGGIAIGAAVLFGLLALVDEKSFRLMIVLIGAAVMVVAGVIDDLRPMTPLQKYGPQVIAAATTSLAIQPDLTVTLPYLDFTFTGAVGMVFSAIFITSIINAFNFMDGIDGLAGGFGVLAALGLVIVSGGPLYILLPVALALAGFLFWNLSPASIFMGDGGSQLIGYLLGVGAITSSESSVQIILPLLIVTPFLFDTGFTLLRRLQRGENVFYPHRNHLYQRVVDAGAPQRSVTNVYLGGTSACILFAATYDHLGSLGRLMILVIVGIIAFASVSVVRRFEHTARLTGHVT